jgi:regulator of protease activity HflC (stomatin/prohibitin superfamily)
MAFLISAIATLMALLVFFNSKRLIENPTAQLIVKAVSLLISLLAGINAITRILVTIPAGAVGVEDFQGKVSDRSLSPGIHTINPFVDIIQFSTRLRDVKEEISATSKEGLALGIDVSIQYRLDPAKAPSVYQNIGLDEQEIVVSRFRSIARETIAKYNAEAVYATKRSEIVLQLREKLQLQITPLGFIVDEALLRDVKVPDTLQAAIEQRLKAEQENIQMEFILAKEKQEADRKRIEAQGQSDAQKILSQGLTPAILQLRAIEAAEKLSLSPNSKVVITGNGQISPLILPVDRDKAAP